MLRFVFCLCLTSLKGHQSKRLIILTLLYLHLRSYYLPLSYVNRWITCFGSAHTALAKDPRHDGWEASYVSLSALCISGEGRASQISHHGAGEGGYHTGRWICLSSPQVCKPLFKIGRGLGTFLKRNHVSGNVTFLNQKVLLPTRKSQKNASLSLCIVLRQMGAFLLH